MAISLSLEVVFADEIPRQLKMTKSSISHGGNQPRRPDIQAAAVGLGAVAEGLCGRWPALRAGLAVMLASQNIKMKA